MIVDIIIILIILGSVFLGMKKGLISCVIDILAVIIAIVLAFALCKPITNIVISKTNFDENIILRLKSCIIFLWNRHRFMTSVS